MSLLPPRKRKDQQPADTTSGNQPQAPILPVIDERIIRNLKPEYELSAIVGLKISTIYKHAALGTFPRPVKITGRATGWRWSQVKQWLDGKRDWRETA